MKKISESEMWGLLKTGDLVIETDADRSAFLLMHVTRVSDTAMTFDRLRILYDTDKIFDTDTLERFLIGPEDDLDDFSPKRLDGRSD